MNGDGKPDLVIADTLSGCLTTARTQWLVYLGNGNGFATTPTSWTVPSYGACAFNQGTSGSAGAATSVGYSTLDMNGDGKPEMVVTADSSTCATTVNPGEWLVYAGPCQ